MKGEATKEFLEQFDDDSEGVVHKVAPVEFRPRPPKLEPSRLGRSLKDIMSRPVSLSLFKK